MILWWHHARPSTPSASWMDYQNFAHPTKMVANELKTKYMFFEKLNDYSLQLNGKHLEKDSSHRYVGNMISCNRLLSGDILKENSDFLCNKTRQSVFAMIGKLTNLDEPTRTILFLYPPHNEVVGGVYWFHSVRPSVCPSVRPSVPHAVSALYHLQLWMDSFHIRHKWSLPWEGVSCTMTFDLVYIRR